MQLVLDILKNPRLMFAAIIAISLLCLGAAFAAEAILLLEPCILCIYQRYPYALAALLGLIGLYFNKNVVKSALLLFLISLTFLANSAIATYHSGIERHWWQSAVEGCAVSFDNSPDTKTMLENILSAPMGHCDEIPWADPILGLSMANYNVFLCFGLFLICAIGGVMLVRK